MIVGTGVDICQVSRVAAARAKHGERFDARILAPSEIPHVPQNPLMAARHVAKRFAAKEALGKALGTGIRAPLGWQAASVVNDALGRPSFALVPALASLTLMRDKVVANLSDCAIHLSLSDDGDYAIAMVTIELPHALFS
jgi:holo-[acyl-carrier protein] synthase